MLPPRELDSFKRASERAERKGRTLSRTVLHGRQFLIPPCHLLEFHTSLGEKILHAPLRALTAHELPSEGGGPLVLPAGR